jgi:sugar/nucleoside kinase (ribokinase family)
VSFLGKVGQDDDGAFYMDSLKKLGGDVSAFSFSSGAHTGRCLSLITPDSERTMRTDLGAAAELSGEDVTADKFNGITHVHVEGYMLFNEELFRGVVALAKEKNCTVSVDLASFEVVKAKKDVLPELLEKYVDIVFANEDEAAEFSNGGTPEKWLDCLSRFCRTAAVKLGGKGSIIKNSGEVVSVKAETVKAVDTTGAGDLWQTGFLYGFLNGKDLETCGRYGSILGAEVVKVIGADIPEERWREIDVRVKL